VPTVHPSSRDLPNVFPSPLTPTRARGTPSPFCWPWVPFRSVPFSSSSLRFHPVESRSVVRSPPVHPARARRTGSMPARVDSPGRVQPCRLRVSRVCASADRNRCSPVCRACPVPLDRACAPARRVARAGLRARGARRQVPVPSHWNRLTPGGRGWPQRGRRLGGGESGQLPQQSQPPVGFGGVRCWV